MYIKAHSGCIIYKNEKTKKGKRKKGSKKLIAKLTKKMKQKERI